jgi:hypothetical protein
MFGIYLGFRFFQAKEMDVAAGVPVKESISSERAAGVLTQVRPANAAPRHSSLRLAWHWERRFFHVLDAHISLSVP